jgi:hypothetical protein
MDFGSTLHLATIGTASLSSTARDHPCAQKNLPTLLLKGYLLQSANAAAILTTTGGGLSAS